MQRKSDYEAGGNGRENSEQKREEEEKIRNNFSFAKTYHFTAATVEIVCYLLV
jgi:hypothetical protein